MIGFSLTTIFALFLFTKITQPMQQLIQAANAIREGEYSTRLNLITSDEIGQLANTFNHMAAELESNVCHLKHEKEHLFNVLRSMTDAVFTFDHEGNIRLQNPPGEQLLEIWKPHAKSGHYPLAAAMNHTVRVPDPLQSLFLQVMSSGRDEKGNMQVGTDVWSVQMTPLYSDNDLRGALAVLRNITEQVKLEKMRRDFLANVSHELRTPLSMMQGYSEALLDGMATSWQQTDELVQVIYEECLRMSRLVDNLLDLARVEATHTDYVMSKVNIIEVLDRVYRKFCVRAKENKIALHWSKPFAELILYDADADRLEQVFTNLLDNAFTYTPSGKKIVIKLDKGTFHKKQEQIRIQIVDEGIGICDTDVPFVFDRFYKADKARVRGKNASTGLGLAIVKNIVDAHQGMITVRSTVGQGTCFTILFPVGER